MIDKPCRTCAGQGRVRREKTLKVNIPAGVEDGTRIRLSGEGEAGTRGGPAGATTRPRRRRPRGAGVTSTVESTSLSDTSSALTCGASAGATGSGSDSGSGTTVESGSMTVDGS